MKINLKTIGLFILLIMIVSSYLSSLKNIDLAYNIDHLDRDKYLDDNGIIKQDIESMYQNAFIYLWIAPILIITNISLIFYFNK